MPVPRPDQVKPSALRTAAGDARVAHAVALLDDLADRPLDEHPDIFADVFSRLQGALTDPAG